MPVGQPQAPWIMDPLTALQVRDFHIQISLWLLVHRRAPCRSEFWRGRSAPVDPKRLASPGCFLRTSVMLESLRSLPSALLPPWHLHGAAEVELSGTVLSPCLCTSTQGFPGHPPPSPPYLRALPVLPDQAGGSGPPAPPHPTPARPAGFSEGRGPAELLSRAPSAWSKGGLAFVFFPPGEQDKHSPALIGTYRGLSDLGPAWVNEKKIESGKVVAIVPLKDVMSSNVIRT